VKGGVDGVVRGGQRRDTAVGHEAVLRLDGVLLGVDALRGVRRAAVEEELPSLAALLVAEAEVEVVSVVVFAGGDRSGAQVHDRLLLTMLLVVTGWGSAGAHQRG